MQLPEVASFDMSSCGTPTSQKAPPPACAPQCPATAGRYVSDAGDVDVDMEDSGVSGVSGVLGCNDDDDAGAWCELEDADA